MMDVSASSPTTTHKMSTKTSCLAASVAALAVLVSVLFNNPELVLNIPSYGFIVYHILGGPLPAFIENDTFKNCGTKEGCPWLHSGDVVISVCSKCGTNWLMTMVHELRTWNVTDLKEFDDIYDVVPWAEMRHFPGQTMKERVDYWGHEWNNTRLPFRAFKAHFIPTELPVIQRPDVKFIAVSRKTEDALLSAVEFLPKLSKELREMCGGYPPDGLTIPMFISMLEQNPSFNYYEYFKSWYIAKDLPNVLVLHYSDIFKNPRKYIEIVADFLELKGITKEALDIVEQRTSFKFMKNRGEKYMNKIGKDKKFYVMSGPDGVVNKGGIGVKEGRPFVTDEDRKNLLKIREKVFGDNNLLAHLVDEGFEAESTFKSGL